MENEEHSSVIISQSSFPRSSSLWFDSLPAYISGRGTLFQPKAELTKQFKMCSQLWRLSHQWPRPRSPKSCRSPPPNNSLIDTISVTLWATVYQIDLQWPNQTQHYYSRMQRHLTAVQRKLQSYKPSMNCLAPHKSFIAVGAFFWISVFNSWLGSCEAIHLTYSSSNSLSLFFFFCVDLNTSAEYIIMFLLKILWITLMQV